MNSKKKVHGSCLCGKVHYEFTESLGIFQYCHCERCRKFTGSAHAANIFVSPDNFNWVKGENFVGKFELPDTKYFATSFCQNCGSSLPWMIQTGKTMVVPAGTLDDDPGIKPTQNIFCAFDAKWYVPASDLKSFEELPVSRNS
ncbi:GFA family protein [Aliikangiella sp. G2MR2-5]|uniref:GFA family protein n=1 Tax=Aliikangiella sp. G2MR2-5 TaxID=2788943 RepID=UPI0018A9ED76|nr:GFA family protein [Aliikangiella sp. G2MR2-5]